MRACEWNLNSTNRCTGSVKQTSISWVSLNSVINVLGCCFLQILWEGGSDNCNMHNAEFV